MQYVAIGLVVLIALFGLTWAGQGNDFFLFKVFAPKYEQVRRETFEESKAYRQGVAQEIARAYQDYERPGATQQQKDAIAAIVRHQTADYDATLLPAHLRAFVRSLR